MADLDFDHVFRSIHHEQVLDPLWRCLEKANVSSSQPSINGEQFSIRGRVVEVALNQARRLHENLTGDVVCFDVLTSGIDETYFNRRQKRSA